MRIQNGPVARGIGGPSGSIRSTFARTLLGFDHGGACVSELGYLLVTPLRDAAAMLDELVVLVRRQELRPAQWLLVDDGSTDGTAERLDRIAEREPWISVVHLSPPAGPPAATRYSEVVGLGFRTATELAEAEGKSYRYLANLDPEIRIPPNLFAELVTRMEADRLVGVSTCRMLRVHDDGREETLLENPCGASKAGIRLWRRACLDDVGLYPTPHWAGVTEVRARNRGWKTIVHHDLRAETVGAELGPVGWWQDYRRRGEAVWHVGLHPLLVAAEAVQVSAQERDLRGLAMLAGYVESAFRRRRRCRDSEVLTYYGEMLPRERLSLWVDRVREQIRRATP